MGLRRLLGPTRRLTTTAPTSTAPPPRPPRRSLAPTIISSTPTYNPQSLRARFLPFTTPSKMSWNAVLEQYARKKNPRKDIPEGVFLQADDKTVTIFDGYEKAKYHFLVMPRDPFPLDDGTKLPSGHLESLSKLLKSQHKLEVLKALERQADEVKEMIQDEMQKEEGWTWDVQIGFHAVESMRHVHLHVISSDLISPKLKNKKHYNSFHPKLGFFLHLHEVIEGVEDGSLKLQPPKHYESILKDDLVSYYNDHTYPNIPKLKVHLEEEWKKLGVRRKKEIEAAEAKVSKGDAAEFEEREPKRPRVE